MELFFLCGSGSPETFLGHLAGAKTLGEFFHASGSINKLLLAGEKGMTGRADAQAEILLGRARMIDRATGTNDLAVDILRVNIGFHGSRKTYLNLSSGQVPIEEGDPQGSKTGPS
jgi:hypothetical protein